MCECVCVRVCGRDCGWVCVKRCVCCMCVVGEWVCLLLSEVESIIIQSIRMLTQV